ncbi:MAG: 2,3-bisphosphoglycerate-independent phosphoglycerate mutase [Thiohalomonadales bacterium]
MSEFNLAPRCPVVLVILDGLGINPCRLNNAVAMAKMPRLDEYFTRYPLTLLQASGSAVGLPDGQMGNSEVGHLTLGCGDVVRQDLVTIDQSISDGSFYNNAELCATMQRAKVKTGTMHLLGLVSDGGVHSHLRHLLALIEMCRRYQVKPLLHMITDGRDTAPRRCLQYLIALNKALDDADGKILTISGRFYAMDRDNRWNRVELAWQVIVNNQGPHNSNLEATINSAYENGMGDEFIPPTVINEGYPLSADDEIIFFNFRKDRARQLTAALFKVEFNEFPRADFQPLAPVCMTEFDEWFQLPYAFAQDKPKTTLAESISRANIRQFHCAETEKYAHVTYFLNGRRGDVLAGEDRIIVPSPQVETYDQAPAMNAAGIAEQVIDAIKSGLYGFIAVNFANGDMLGHTGNLAAAVQSLQALDHEVGRVLDVAQNMGFSVLLTADHGNCEQMVETGTDVPHTQHTVFPVPCMVMDRSKWQLSVGAGLSSVAPTILHLMGLAIPPEMSGHSLLLNPAS